MTTTKPARLSVQHVSEIRACFFCRQAGQPVQLVLLTLAATELTPAWLPEQVAVAAYVCVDEETCRRVAPARQVHREAVERVQ